MPSVSIPTAIMGVASVGSAIIGGSAAKSAAKTQAKAAESSAELQMQMFQQIQANLKPYMQIGTGAMPMIAGLTGTQSPQQQQLNDLQAQYSAMPPAQQNSQPGQDLQGQISQLTSQIQASGGNPLGAQPFNPQEFLAKTPGYQFTLNQGLQAVQNAGTAQGLSGATIKGAANYAEGLASTTYENRLNDYFRLLETGQSAAGALGVVGTTTGANVGATMTSGAAATAAGTVGAANAITGGISNLGGLAYMQSQGMFEPRNQLGAFNPPNVNITPQV